jgi:N-acetylmuramoyl-L-alanine amidase
MAFIDNVDDSKILIQRQDDLALAITKGICKYLGFEYTPVTTDSDTFYRVICGSFNNNSSAEQRINELKSLGYNDVFIDVYTK